MYLPFTLAIFISNQTLPEQLATFTCRHTKPVVEGLWALVAICIVDCLIQWWWRRDSNSRPILLEHLIVVVNTVVDIKSWKFKYMCLVATVTCMWSNAIVLCRNMILSQRTIEDLLLSLFYLDLHHYLKLCLYHLVHHEIGVKINSI